MPFSAIDKAPGVYIEEVQLPGPIKGVGTSTAAFIGPARNGPINTPTFLTNWTQFLETFSIPDALGPFITAPLVYVTHAVRGFFENGGASCYFVRVSTAARASLNLKDRAGTPTLNVAAKQDGVAGKDITVEVLNDPIAATTAVKAAGVLTGPSTTTTVDLANAADFHPGDIVLLDGGGNSQRATIDHIAGTTITFTSALKAYPAGAAMRIADLAPGQRTFRVAAATGIETGSYVAVTPQGGATQSRVVQSVDTANNLLTLSQGFTNNIPMDAADPIVDVETQEFALRIVTPGAGTENFTQLSMNPGHSRYFATSVNSSSVDVSLADPPSTSLPPRNIPAVLGAKELENGLDDDLSQIQTAHYQAGIDGLERVDDVNILCIPDRTDQGIQQAMIDHCEKMSDRFAVLDPQRNSTIAAISAQRLGVNSDNGYAALYYPWITIRNPVAEGRITVPPSGHVAGLYARTDGSRGVHKAPANDTLRGVLALERTLSDDEQGPLNEDGINVIRAFPGRGIRVWGARTIASNTQWQYINVRRLMLFIEESIQEGTQFAVFEPNDIGLWAILRRQVTDFLTNVWRDGALVGAAPSDAFHVRVDEELNPPSKRALGILTIEVIVYPTTPAEFIVFRIIQQPGGPSVEE
jgi:phage tail sheath protein FI